MTHAGNDGKGLPLRKVVGRADLYAISFVLVVMGVMWLRLSGLTWLGWDAYPILATCELDVPMLRPLADDYLPARFFRPFFVATVAASQALGGTASFAIAINIALFGGVLCALWLLVSDRRLAGLHGCWVGGLTLFFVTVHPAVVATVPYMPRRADLLCALFVLLALFLDRQGRVRLAVICAVLALASKETAMVLPFLVALDRWLVSRQDVAKGLLIYGWATAAMVITRGAVLGGVGGYVDVERALPFSPKVVLATGVELLVPSSGLMWRELAWVAVGVCALAILWALNRRFRFRDVDIDDQPLLRATAWGLLWIVPLALLFGVAGRVSPWYLTLVGVGAFTAFSAVTVLAWKLARRGAGLVVWAWLLGVALLVIAMMPTSIFVDPLGDLHHASRLQSDFLEGLKCQVETGTAGMPLEEKVVEVVTYPRVLSQGGRRRFIPMLRPRTIAAWIALEGLQCTVESPEGRWQAVQESRSVGRVDSGICVVRVVHGQTLGDT